MGYRPLRLSVRTSGFHPEKRSSILLGVANYGSSIIEPDEFLD